jgi:two-component system OmpR family sensor kinase
MPTASIPLPGRKRQKPNSLRRQFVTGGVGLVALASIVIGIASSVAVGRTLIAGLDEDLADAARRVSVSLQQPDTVPLNRPGFDVGTVVAVITGTEVSGAYIDGDGQLQVLESHQVGGLRSIEWQRGKPVFVNLMDGEGEYRAQTVAQIDGSQIVVGLPLRDIRISLARLNLIIIVVVTLVIALGATIGAGLVRFALKPLDRIRETASAVTKQPLDRGEVRLGLRVPPRYATDDSEVGQVGAALNLMLDHVDDAFKSRFESEEKMRRFVADASHELRTPLAAIRGYAELTKKAGGKLPEDLQKALDRIESESIRMTSLVEDLLLLARLDESGQLEKEPVDLAKIIRDALSDAYVTSPDHDWGAQGIEDPVMVDGDSQSLHQVVVNLLANARVHTSPGTSVEARLSQTSQATKLQVEDSGPGIPKEARKSLFQRFARGDSSRARSSGSTGLGLSIVDTIVKAHGGTVSLRSKPGKTVFTVTFPRQQVAKHGRQALS